MAYGINLAGMQSVTYMPGASSHLPLESCLIIPSSDMNGEQCPQFLTSAGLTVLVDHCRMSSASKSPFCVSLEVITVALTSHSSK